MVTGQYEPNDDEADWPSDEEKEDELAVSCRNFFTVHLLKQCNIYTFSLVFSSGLCLFMLCSSKLYQNKILCRLLIMSLPLNELIHLSIN